MILKTIHKIELFIGELNTIMDNNENEFEFETRTSFKRKAVKKSSSDEETKKQP